MLRQRWLIAPAVAAALLFPQRVSADWWGDRASAGRGAASRAGSTVKKTTKKASSGLSELDPTSRTSGVSRTAGQARKSLPKVSSVAPSGRGMPRVSYIPPSAAVRSGGGSLGQLSRTIDPTRRDSDLSRGYTRVMRRDDVSKTVDTAKPYVYGAGVEWGRRKATKVYDGTVGPTVKRFDRQVDRTIDRATEGVRGTMGRGTKETQRQARKAGQGARQAGGKTARYTQGKGKSWSDKTKATGYRAGVGREKEREPVDDDRPRDRRGGSGTPGGRDGGGRDGGGRDAGGGRRTEVGPFSTGGVIRSPLKTYSYRSTGVKPTGMWSGTSGSPRAHATSAFKPGPSGFKSASFKPSPWKAGR